MTVKTSSSRLDWTLVAVLSVSLALNLFLGIREYQDYRQRAVQERLRTGLTPGSRVPPLIAESLGGEEVNIRYDDVDVPTVLYVTNSTCIWCARNAENAKALESGASSYRFLTVSLDKEVQPLSDFISRFKVSSPVFFRPRPGSIAEYGLGSTPQTLVISTSGRVLKAWRGAYIATVAKEVEDFFKIRLPGLPVPVANVQPGQ